MMVKAEVGGQSEHPRGVLLPTWKWGSVTVAASAPAPTPFAQTVLLMREGAYALDVSAPEG